MKGTGEYPKGWDLLARHVKDEAGWRCVRCGAPNSIVDFHVLTVHHLDGDKSNCAWWNLVALCQRCHLIIQAKVQMGRGYLFTHTLWFQPYAAGYYAAAILGKHLTRREVMARLDELLALGQPWLYPAERSQDAEAISPPSATASEGAATGTTQQAAEPEGAAGAG